MKSDMTKFDELEFQKDAMLFVIDFSAIANIRSQDTLKEITDYILVNNIKVAVSREFYENYEVIIKSTNDEQKGIAKLAYSFLSSLGQNNCLLYMSDIVNSKDIISKLHKNPKVCFVYYKNSDFSEFVIEYKDNLLSKAIVIDENGDFNVYLDTETIVNESVLQIDSSAQDDDYFSTSFQPADGVKVKTRDNEVIILEDLVGSGGEGAVYDCNYRNNYVVKVYHKGQLNKLRLKKIDQFICFR